MSSHDERRPRPGLDGQPEPGSPAWDIDPYIGKPYGYHRPMPLSPSASWLKKNFTFGNIVVILTMLVAAGAWVRSTETRDIALGDRVHQTEGRVQRLEQDTISKELLGARLDTIAERLKAIEDRLSKIERMKQ